MTRRRGRVVLAGFVPDHADLITHRAERRQDTASLVIVSPSLPTAVRPQDDTQIICIDSDQPLSDDPDIWSRVVAAIDTGANVLRWYEDNPLASETGRRDAAELSGSNIQIELVPVIPPEIIAATFAGIPLPSPPRIAEIANSDRAFDVSIGVGAPGSRRSASPTFVIEHPGTPAQSTRVGVRPSGPRDACYFSGSALEGQLQPNWFASLPLFGQRVLVTRTRNQASVMSDNLRQLGAEPIEMPAIEIVPNPYPSRTRQAVENLPRYDWVIFTSTNGVDQFMAILRSAGYDTRRFTNARIAAIGNATGERLRRYMIEPDFIPDEFVAEAVLNGLRAYELDGTRILIPRAEVARETLPDGLRARGAEVDVVPVYRTIPGTPSRDTLQRLRRGEIDIVTFTSSSTVTNLLAMLNNEPEVLGSATIACIGPITAKTARDHGLNVSIVAEEYTIPGLIDALCLAREEAA